MCNCSPHAGPLHQAIARGNLEEVRRLLEVAEPGSYTQHNLDQGLMIASLNGNRDCSALLLDCGARVESRSDELWTPLMHAARGGDPGTVTLLLERGADVGLVNNYGRTALIEAAWAGHADAVDLLISAGSALDLQPSGVGGPALAEAMWNNYPEVVQLLLDAGANPLFQLEGRADPLTWAATKGYQQIVGQLLELGLDPRGRGPGGEGPLLGAVRRGHLEVARMLLERGAEINVQNSSGTTALIASSSQSPELVKLLLDWGADLSLCDEHGKTALCEAASSGNLAVVRRLALSEGSPSSLPPGTGSPLECAARHAHLEVMEWLLGNLDLDVNHQSDRGWTSLMTAAQNGHAAAVTLLLRHGADPSLSNRRGENAAVLAASSGVTDVLQQLADAGVDVAAPSLNGNSTLCAAIRGERVFAGRGNRLATVRWLLDRGVGTNRFTFGRSPLMEALLTGCIDLVEELIARGADVNLVNERGQTALHVAAGEGQENERRPQPTSRKRDRMAVLIDLLLEAGADPAPGGGTGILALAAGNRCPEVVRRLLDEGVPVDPPLQENAWTPLMAGVGSVRILRHLLRRGADPNRRDPAGGTALHAAVRRWVPVVKALRTLVRAGAEVNAADDAGTTPLLAAAATGVMENVRELLSFGADRGILDGQGRGAVEIANASGNREIVKLLQG